MEGISPDGIPYAIQDELLGYYESPYWGLVASICLFGIILAQGYTYATTNNDRWTMNALVAVLIGGDLVSLCLQSSWMHYYLLENYGRPRTLLTMVPTGSTSLLLSYVTGYIVELFFVRKVYLLTRQKVIAFIIFMLATIACASAMTATISMYIDSSVTNLRSEPNLIFGGVYAGGSALTACLVTVVLSRSFRVGTGKDGNAAVISSTANVLHRLLFFVVTRGIAICLLQITNLALYLAAPSRLYWTAFVAASSRVYIITLLVIVNSRQSLRASLNDVITASDFNIPNYNHSRKTSTVSLGEEPAIDVIRGRRGPGFDLNGDGGNDMGIGISFSRRESWDSVEEAKAQAKMMKQEQGRFAMKGKLENEKERAKFFEHVMGADAEKQLEGESRSQAVDSGYRIQVEMYTESESTAAAVAVGQNAEEQALSPHDQRTPLWAQRRHSLRTRGLTL